MPHMGEHGKGNVLQRHHALLGGGLHFPPVSGVILAFVVESFLGQDAYALRYIATRQKVLQIIGADSGDNAFALIYEDTVCLLSHA